MGLVKGVEIVYRVGDDGHRQVVRDEEQQREGPPVQIWRAKRTSASTAASLPPNSPFGFTCRAAKSRVLNAVPQGMPLPTPR